jgi:hypothetical protein
MFLTSVYQIHYEISSTSDDLVVTTLPFLAFLRKLFDEFKNVAYESMLLFYF